MALSDTYASIPVASEGNLVKRSFYRASGSQPDEWSYGSSIETGDNDAAINNPFGDASLSPADRRAEWAWNYYNDTADSNGYIIYDYLTDGMTRGEVTPTRVPIKNGTYFTFAFYARNKNAVTTGYQTDNRTSSSHSSGSGNPTITWASASEGAAVSDFVYTGGTRAWYEAVGNDGWNRFYVELSYDGAGVMRAEVQPNRAGGSTTGVGCYLWGPEVQYGSLNVAGRGGATSAYGGLYMTGGGVFDVECLVDVEYFRPIRRIPFASGHTYTSGVYRQDKRRWRVTVRAADLTVTQNLQAFFNIHNGMEHPFFFTVPITDSGVGFPWTSGAGHTANAQETVTGYFSEDVLHIQEIGPSVYDISFSVEELLVK